MDKDSNLDHCVEKPGLTLSVDKPTPALAAAPHSLERAPPTDTKRAITPSTPLLEPRAQSQSSSTSSSLHGEPLDNQPVNAGHGVMSHDAEPASKKRNLMEPVSTEEDQNHEGCSEPSPGQPAAPGNPSKPAIILDTNDTVVPAQQVNRSGRPDYPSTRENGTLRNPQRNIGVVDINNEWAAGTWISKAGKKDMRYLLEHAGRWTDEMRNWGLNQLANHLEARNRGAAEGRVVLHQGGEAALKYNDEVTLV